MERREQRRRVLEQRRKRRRRKQIKRFLILASYSAVIIFFILKIKTQVVQSSETDTTSPEVIAAEYSAESVTPEAAAISEALTRSEAFAASEGKEASLLSGDDLYSSNAILVSLSDNSILLDKNSQEKIYPASLTKIMTALVALENLEDLEEEILLPEKMFSDLYQENASMAGFSPGERVSAIDLIYGVLLPSGAECSQGLAIHIAGSEKEFVKMMNQRAESLGMKNTHFANVTGLHDKNHYTTVADIAVLLSYALENDIFKTVFTSPDHMTAATNLQEEGIWLDSTLFRKIDTPYFNEGQILGGKTGYTGEAGLCLASLAEYQGKDYILVTAGALGDPYSEQTNITDAFTVYTGLSENDVN